MKTTDIPIQLRKGSQFAGFYSWCFVEFVSPAVVAKIYAR